jgi:hypothetical protein
MPRGSYRVETRRIEELFDARSVYFAVPDFQRSYAWSPDEVTELLDDVYDDDGRGAARSTYFLGSIVLAGDDPFLVLDGQQRLATVSLLLAAIADRLLPLHAEHGQHLRNMLLGGRFGERLQPKLTLQPGDRELFRALLDAPSDPGPGREPLRRALAAIQRHIDAMLERRRARGATDKSSLVELGRRVLNEVELVQIVAPTESDAFRLFETLNDRGLPLNAADLIKNKLFARAGRELADVKSAWRQTLESTGPEEILAFLRYYWAAFYGSVRKDALYEAFGERLEGLDEVEALALASDLAESAELYAAIALPSRARRWDSDTNDALQRLVDLRVRSCRPLLLAVARRTEPDIARVVTLCETVAVRYLVVGGYPSVLERAFEDACRRLATPAPADVEAAVREALRAVVPRDEDFEAAFASRRVPRVGPADRALLLRLNAFGASGETSVRGAREVHVEHVLPRNPSRRALEEAALSLDEASELSEHVGNLTLLSGRRNVSISNAEFSSKRAAFEESEIALNRWIAMRTRWGRAEIEQRDRVLARIACAAWPWDLDEPRGDVDASAGERATPHPTPRVTSEALARTPAPTAPGLEAATTQGLADGAATSLVEATEDRRVEQVESASPDMPDAPDVEAVASKGEVRDAAEGALPLLGRRAKIFDSVWVPRVLWALEWIRRHESGAPANAAKLSKVLTERGGTRVPGTNVARAFREFGATLRDRDWIEEPSPLHYRITTHGTEALLAVTGRG